MKCLTGLGNMIFWVVIIALAAIGISNLGDAPDVPPDAPSGQPPGDMPPGSQTPAQAGTGAN